MANLKATFDRARLLTAVKSAAAVAVSRVKPILENVCLSVSNNGNSPTVSATNLDIGVRAVVGGEVVVSSPGDVLLPAKRFLAILQASTGDVVDIVVSDAGKATIKCDGGRFSLPTCDVDEFPAVDMGIGGGEGGGGNGGGGGDNPQSNCHVTICADAFAAAVKRTSFACDEASSHYALGGVRLEVVYSQDNVAFIATDGRRLVVDMVKGGATDGKLNGRDTIIPKAAISLMAKASAEAGKFCDVSTSDLKERVRLAPAENAVWFHAGHVEIFARMVEGRFPKWQDVYPSDDAGTRPAVLSVPVSAMESVVRQAMIVTSQDRPGVAFEVVASSETGGHKLRLNADGAEFGTATVEVDIERYDGPAGTPQAVRLNPVFVLDFLHAVHGTFGDDAVVGLEFRGKDRAVVARCGEYSGVIMPLNS